MLGQCPVARLAGDHHVLALLFLIDDIRMAAFADVVAGKGNGPGSSFRNRGAAVVTVLSKAARYDRLAQDDERNHGYGDDDCKPDEVFNVLKQCRLSAPDSGRTVRAKLRNALRYLVFLSGTMIGITESRDGGHSAF